MVRRRCPGVRLEHGTVNYPRLQRWRDRAGRARESRAFTETDPWTVRTVFGSLLVVQRFRLR